MRSFPALQVLHHQQLSLCKHPHIVEFHEVFLTPRYLGGLARSTALTGSWHDGNLCEA